MTRPQDLTDLAVPIRRPSLLLALPVIVPIVLAAASAAATEPTVAGPASQEPGSPAVPTDTATGDKDGAGTKKAKKSDAAPPPPTTVLDEVVVTAPRMTEPLVVETDPKAPRQPVPPNDGAGYLKSIPGFSVARKGGVDGDPLLRGQGGSRLNVLLDGTPLLGGCGNRMDPPTAYIFPDSFDRLTVLKGPQSVVHGGTALGTVLVDRETRRFDKPSVRGNASALYGSFDRNDEVIDAAAGASEGYIRAIGTHSSSDDYRDGRGNALHSNYWRASGTAILGWTPDDRTRIEASYDRSDAQVAYADRSMDGTKFDREGVRLQATRTDLSPLVAKVKATAYHNYVDHVMDTYTLRPYLGGATAANSVDHLMQGGKLLTELTPGPGTTITLGADYNHDIHTARSLSRAEYLAGTGIESKVRVADLSFDTVAAFGEVSHDLTDVDRLIGGYRFTHVDATRHNVGPNLTDDRSLHSAFGRYERTIDVGFPLTAYAGLGHIERAPDYWERRLSTASFTVRTEKTNQLDIGTLFNSGNWRGSLSTFYADTSGYILVSSSQSRNVGAHTWGGEAELAYRFLPLWAIEGTLAYVEGTNETDRRPLAQMPPLEGTLAVKYDDGAFLGGVLLRAVAGQDRFDTGWGNIIGQDIGRTGGFATLAANVGWRPHHAVTLTAGIDNILDKAYAEHVSKGGTLTGMSDLTAYADSTRVNEPGRTWWMKGSVKF